MTPEDKKDFSELAVRMQLASSNYAYFGEITDLLELISDLQSGKYRSVYERNLHS